MVSLKEDRPPPCSRITQGSCLVPALGAKHRLLALQHCGVPTVSLNPCVVRLHDTDKRFLRRRWLVQCLADKLSSCGAAIAWPTLLMRLGSLALMRCT